MRFWDCVDLNTFDNYWFLDGVSDRLLGCHKFKQINIQGSVIELENTPRGELSFQKTIATIIKLVSMLTLFIPAIMLIGKAVFHWNHVFTLSEKPLAANERILVGTYNILFPQKLVNGLPPKICTNIGYSADDEGNLYENSIDRVGIIAENILKSDLDVICLQEATDSMCQLLQTSLKDRYEIKWIKHENFHGVGILFKQDKFKLLHEKALSVTVQMENPANPGEYQPSPNRVHLLNDLMDKTTQKVYRFVSCHMFDPRSLQNKIEQTKYVIDFAEKEPNGYFIDRTIIAGDMNQDQFGDVLAPPKGVLPSETLAPSFQPFIDNEYQVDGNYDSTEYEKKMPGNGKIRSKNRHIDWIWVKKSKPQHHPLTDFDQRGSDHKLVASLIC